MAAVAAAEAEAKRLAGITRKVKDRRNATSQLPPTRPTTTEASGDWGQGYDLDGLLPDAAGCGAAAARGLSAAGLVAADGTKISQPVVGLAGAVGLPSADNGFCASAAMQLQLRAMHAENAALRAENTRLRAAPPAAAGPRRATRDRLSRLRVRGPGTAAQHAAQLVGTARHAARRGGSTAAALQQEPMLGVVRGGVGGACRLRILQWNDVYELDNYPRFATARKRLAVAAHKTIAVMAGDFLMPSLLSSLDHGRGVVDAMNAAGFDYCCFGNHEDDVPHHEMLKRVAESRFAWVNSNVPGFDLQEHGGAQPWMVDGRLPEHVEFDVRGGGQRRSVALLGLCTPDGDQYQNRRPFGGATMEPIIPSAERMLARKEVAACDLVIPLTHQYMPEEDRFQEHFQRRFPLVLGGHDHSEILSTVEGSTVVKTGCDGAKIGVIDICWPDAQSDMIEVSIELAYAADFEPDPIVQGIVNKHKAVLPELEHAVLCRTPPDIHLSSKAIRLRQTTVGALLCSCVRDGLGADCALINAGAIRGDRDYGAEHKLTYGDLKRELPLDSLCCVVPLPGRVLADLVLYSRRFAARGVPTAKGCFLQLCDALRTAPMEMARLTHVNGKCLVPDRVYRCAVLYLTAVHGLDGLTPMTDHLKAAGTTVVEDICRPMKSVVVSVFTRQVWANLIEEFRFDELDTSGDGHIERSELEAALARRWERRQREKAAPKKGEVATSPAIVGRLALDNLFACADLDHDGKISRREFFQLFLLTHHFREERINTEQAVAYAEAVLGKGAEAMETARGVVAEFGADGYVLREQLAEAVDRHMAKGETGYTV